MATFSSSERHFYQEWPSLSFLEDFNAQDTEEDDVEVTKVDAAGNAGSNKFDPVVGGRFSQYTPRSSSSRSSGSTGFYEAVELSPTSSLSPNLASVTFPYFYQHRVHPSSNLYLPPALFSNFTI